MSRGRYHNKAEYVTTGEAGRILSVAPRTISNWVDQGRLPGWRVNKDRRVFFSDLVKFAEENGMPLRNIEDKVATTELASSVSAYQKEIKHLKERIFFADGKISVLENLLAQCEEMLTSASILLSDPKFVKVDKDARKEFLDKMARLKILK